MFRLLRQWYRKRLMRRPFPRHWLPFLKKHVPFYSIFSKEQKKRFLDILKVFVWEKTFIGAGGMRVTDELKVVIAAAAARLILYLDLSFFDRLTEIIVYPSSFGHPKTKGILLGEAHHWGIVVLSWKAVLEGMRHAHDGSDTAMHEFAHVLDRASGAFDGTPQLQKLELYRPWARIMSYHFNRLRKGFPQEQSVLDQYAAEDEAEFFAIATEAFFETPKQLRAHTPALFDLLMRFFKYDPISNKGINT